jgi:hypothetical protein
VRHVAPLASGCWLGPSVPKPRRSGKWEARAPAKVTFGALTQALILALVMAGGLRPSWAFDTLGACQAWQNSRGRARIEIAGVILPGFVVNAEREPRRQHPAGISRTRTNSNCRRASPLAGDGGRQFIAAIQH